MKHYSNLNSIMETIQKTGRITGNAGQCVVDIQDFFIAERRIGNINFYRKLPLIFVTHKYSI